MLYVPSYPVYAEPPVPLPLYGFAQTDAHTMGPPSGSVTTPLMLGDSGGLTGGDSGAQTGGDSGGLLSDGLDSSARPFADEP
jgi:hypothetical protein